MSDRVPDPTPEEIRAMCRSIRAGWSKKERKDRNQRKAAPRIGVAWQRGQDLLWSLHAPRRIEDLEEDYGAIR